MNVLSLFDGMSCGQIALNRIGIKPNKYYASEIDKTVKSKLTKKLRARNRTKSYFTYLKYWYESPSLRPVLDKFWKTLKYSHKY